MRKLLVTLDINNYLPELTKITLPNLLSYSKKIGAEFQVIREPYDPRYPISGKFALYEIASNFDWIIFIDIDAIIHPNCPDFTIYLNKDTVLFSGFDPSPCRFRPSDYQLRDGRFLGASTFFTVFSDWTRDLWNPELLQDSERLLRTITPMSFEKFKKPETLLDDCIVSHNIARYGLKATTIPDLANKYKFPPNSLFHLFNCTNETKIKAITNELQAWDTERFCVTINGEECY